MSRRSERPDMDVRAGASTMDGFLQKFWYAAMEEKW
jgi:hypothetical protein